MSPTGLPMSDHDATMAAPMTPLEMQPMTRSSRENRRVRFSEVADAGPPTDHPVDFAQPPPPSTAATATPAEAPAPTPATPPACFDPQAFAAHRKMQKWTLGIAASFCLAIFPYTTGIIDNCKPSHNAGWLCGARVAAFVGALGAAAIGLHVGVHLCRGRRGGNPRGAAAV